MGVKAALQPQPEFLFHEDSAKQRTRGKIAHVVEDFRWGTWEPDGSATVNLKDPALGDVEFRVVISRVTPDLTEMKGVGYTWVRSFPTATLANLVLPMIERRVREASTTSGWLQLAAFHRLRGDAGGAQRALKEARRLGADEAACAGERDALAVGTFQTRLDELRGWMATGREDDALRDAAFLNVPPVLQTSDPLRHRQAVARLSALKARAARHHEARVQLAKRSLPFLSLS
ncbi:MAG: hypothetical protein GY851_05470, partial [bacterium]|nr:hypothetical protein [bacterium]